LLCSVLLAAGVALWWTTGSSPEPSGPIQAPGMQAAELPAAEPRAGLASTELHSEAGRAPGPTAAIATEAAEAVHPLDSRGEPRPTTEPEHDSGESNSWDGGWLTRGAMDKPNMGSLSPDDPGYDAVVEARQLFHPFEMDLRTTLPLEPNSYRETLGLHKQTNAGALRRVNELRRAGHPETASQLYEEWSRLFELYRRRARASQGSQPPPDLAGSD